MAESAAHHHHTRFRKGLHITRPAPALDIAWAVHAPHLDRFHWQLALADDRMVLVSDALTPAVVLPGGGDLREPNDPHEVPPADLPPAVLDAAREAVERADSGELDAVLRRRRQIARLWGVDDVIAVRPDLSDDQAWDVLQEVDLTQDAEAGITWQTLAEAAEALFGPAADDA